MKNTALQHRLEFVDALRGVAIILVYLFHCLTQAFRQDISLDVIGAAGVALFFAVSGFCIHLSFSSHPDWRAFWIKRFFRIYPAYLFAVLWFGLVTQTKDAWQLLSHLLLIHNFSAATFYGLNLSFWSIAIEVQLYAIYPILLWLTRKFGWQRTLWGIGIIEFGGRALVGYLTFGARGDLSVWFVGSPLLYWFSWSIGAAVAESYLRGEESPIGSYSVVAFASVAAASVTVVDTLSFPFYAIAGAILIAKLLKSDTSIYRFPAALKHLSQTGTWSYSLYLIHLPLISLAAYLFRLFGLASWLIFLLCIALYPLILRAAGGLYGLLERPGIAAGSWILRKHPSALPAIS
jgi:peptidoglycan/LPS O-acetylase OafA/YrhL